MALAVGAALWLAVWFANRRWLHMLAVAAAATIAAPLSLIALDPAVLGEQLDTSYLSLLHRLHIWSYVAERITDHPFRGWGLDASRWFEAGHVTVQSSMTAALTVDLLPLHPHNGILQIWLELGLPGVMLLIAIVALLTLGIERYSVSRAALASVAAVIATYGVFAGVSFGIWQSWWLATAWLVAAFALILAGDRDAAGLGVGRTVRPG